MRSSKKLIALFIIICSTLLALPVKIQASNASDAKKSVVYIETNGGSGSGFAIGELGKPIRYIVTNAHVVFDEDGDVYDQIIVCFSAAANNYMYAQVYRYDIQKDIAILRLPEETLERKPLIMCPSKDVNIDDTFAALGYPANAEALNDFVAYSENDIVISKGGIAKQSMINAVDVYMLDLIISNGSSGGPLINSKGEAVGITSFSVSTSDIKEVAYYAIVIDEVIRMINRSEIPYALSTDQPDFPVTILIIAIVVLLLAVIVVILLWKKKQGQLAAKKEKSHPSHKQQKLSKNSSSELSKESSTTFTVTGVTGNYAGKATILYDSLSFGRDFNQCSIHYPADTPGISGLHCKLALIKGRVFLTDLGSTYGTYLGDKSKLVVGSAVELRDGDYFYLGDQNQSFQLRITR